MAAFIKTKAKASPEYMGLQHPNIRHQVASLPDARRTLAGLSTKTGRSTPKHNSGILRYTFMDWVLLVYQ